MHDVQQLDPSPWAYADRFGLATLQFNSMKEALVNPSIRFRIAQARWQLFKEFGYKMRVAESQASSVVTNTVPYNIQGVENSINSIHSLERSNVLFGPLLGIDSIYSYQRMSVFPDLRVLLIGSRTEYEVLMAFGYGFEPDKVEAIDLFSYSPWITPGDMHALPFSDNSFDVIILGWVLTYSTDPWLVADEVIRVAKPGATVSIGIDAHEVEDVRGSGGLEKERPRNVHGLLSFFHRSVGPIYFQNEARYPRDRFPLESNPSCLGHLVATFGINKGRDYFGGRS